MASRNRAAYEEAIRLYIETTGDQEVERLYQSLSRLADGSDGAAEKAGDLVTELQKLAATSNNIRNFTRLKSEISDSGKAIELAKERLSALRSEFEQAERPTRKLERALQQAERQVDSLTKTQNRQSAELQRTSNALTKAGVDTTKLNQAYAQIQGQFGQFANNASRTAAAMDATAQGSRRAAAGVGGLDRAAKSTSVSIAALAARLTTVSGAALTAVKALAAASGAALFTGAIRSAATLEEALSEVRAVSGATAEEMVALKEAAEAGAAATKFTSLEAAQGLGELARATGSAKAAIESLPAALNLAQAAGIGVADAAQFITTTLTQFGLSASEAGRAADVLAKAANDTQADVQGLGNGLSYVAPLAKLLNNDLESTVAVLAALAKQGYQGERAGTALRNVLSELLQPSSAFAKSLRDIGIESTDFETIIIGLAQAGDRGRDALLNLDDAARPAIASLVANAGRDISQLRESLGSVAGEAERVAQVMGNNLPGAAEAIADTFDRTRRSLVEPLLEPLRDELFLLAQDLEAFAQSPEFEEIKGALKDLFIEGAHAARELFSEIDFHQLAVDIRNFVGDANATVTEFRENLDLVVTVVETIGDAFSVVFNAAQAAVFGVASLLVQFINGFNKAARAIGSFGRETAEALGISTEYYQKMDEVIGGLDAVADGFTQRYKANAFEMIDAAKDLAGVNDEVGASATRGLGQAAAAGDRVTAAARQQASASREAAAALTAQGDAAARAASGTSDAAREMEQGAQRLKQAFADLGIESQTNLDRAAESARRNFDLIRKAAGEGKATAEDTRRALAAYAQAARSAVAQSDESTRSRVEGELAVLEAINDVRGGLEDQARAGQSAGAAVASGAQQATEALNQTAAAAERGRRAMLGGGEAAEQLAEGQKQAATQGMALSFSMGEVSDSFRNLMREVLRSQDPLGGFGSLARQLSDQQAEFAKVLDQQQVALKGYDALEGRRKQLRQQFSLIGDAQLEQLLQTENQITQAKQAQADKLRQQQDEERRANEARLEGLKQENEVLDRVQRLPLSETEGKFVIELQYPQPTGGGELTAEERRYADRLLRYLLPQLMNQFNRQRAVSVVQRPRR